MKDETWDVDDIVQISPTHDDTFGGALLVVTETKGWGVQGYVVIPGQGCAYYRLPYEPQRPDCTITGRKVGKAFWLTTPKGA
jgi:hypothetical protein